MNSNERPKMKEGRVKKRKKRKESGKYMGNINEQLLCKITVMSYEVITHY